MSTPAIEILDTNIPTYTVSMPSGTAVTIEATATLGDVMITVALFSLIFILVCWSLYIIAQRIAYHPTQKAIPVRIVNEGDRE